MGNKKGNNSPPLELMRKISFLEEDKSGFV